MRKGEVGEIAARSPLAPAAKEDSEAFSLSAFCLCYTSGFHLGADSSASD